MGLDVPSDPLQSLARLQDLITGIQNAENNLEDKRRSLEEFITNLDSVLTLERTDGREFPPLTACQDAARTLHLHLVQSKDPELGEESSARIQAFKSLLLMVSRGTQVDEDESAIAYEAIVKEFGAKLAVAVTRGLIVIPASATAPAKPPVATTSAVPPDTAGPTPPMKPKLEESSSEVRRELEQAESHVSTVSLPKAEIPSGRILEVPKATETTTRIEVEVAVPPNTTELSRDSLFRYIDGETVKLLASEVLTSAEPFQPSAVQRLAWLSLTERRASVPYHLVRCLERLYPELSLSISSTLIRAYALGTEIRMPFAIGSRIVALARLGTRFARCSAPANTA
jgi:hypothetical protein